MKDEPITLDFSEFQNRESPKINHRPSYYNKVEEYTLDGVYLRTWENTVEAGEYHKVTGGTISHCCQGQPLFIDKLSRIFIKEGDSIEKRLKDIEKKALQIRVKKPRISVDEYDIQGNYIKTWESIASICSSKTPTIVSTISKCCKGKILYSKINKRIFLYSGASIKARLELIEQAKYEAAMSKSITEYSKEGKVTNYWKCASDITEKYDIPVTKILDCCFGKSNSVKGKIFLFSKDSIRERIKRIKSKKKIK